MELRTCNSNFSTRAEEKDLYIEGYFSVFNSNYEIFKGGVETVAPGAFTETLAADDVRCLIDHETRLVLGRNKANTLELREDEHGLWGKVLINPNDTDAMNLYERVKRGDVSQCSFGFDIIDEETEYLDDETVKWTIKKVKLYEVSICTFPAYKDTSVSCRKDAMAEIEKRKNDAWKLEMLTKIKEHK